MRGSFWQIIAFTLVVMPLCTWAATPVADKTFKDWTVFSTDQEGKKVCFITSYPLAKQGSYKRRGEPYFLVTYRGNNVSEISVSSGYPYKEASDVELSLDGGLKKTLFTTDETPRMAWAKTSAEDDEIITAMSKSTRVKIKGHSKVGTYSEDSYSLSGFAKAAARMKSLCGN